MKMSRSTNYIPCKAFAAAGGEGSSAVVCGDHARAHWGEGALDSTEGCSTREAFGAPGCRRKMEWHVETAGQEHSATEA